MEAAMPQHLDALEKANRVRLGRADLRRQVASGEKLLADLLDEELLETAELGDVLRWQRRWSYARMRRFIIAVGISESRPIGELTTRQKAIVRGHLAR